MGFSSSGFVPYFRIARKRAKNEPTKRTELKKKSSSWREKNIRYIALDKLSRRTPIKVSKVMPLKGQSQSCERPRPMYEKSR
mmetsp:Transcript_14168/g.22555  ORF Transcript_14168/g.22555 Transcript_14168/m.22555 type:complete len:82 (+) Transcript_14168:41-286(+)